VPDIAPTLVKRPALSDYRTGGDVSRLLTAAARGWLASNATELKLTLLVIAGVVCASFLT